MLCSYGFDELYNKTLFDRFSEAYDQEEYLFNEATNITQMLHCLFRRLNPSPVPVTPPLKKKDACFMLIGTMFALSGETYGEVILDVTEIMEEVWKPESDWERGSLIMENTIRVFFPSRKSVVLHEIEGFPNEVLLYIKVILDRFIV